MATPLTAQLLVHVLLALEHGKDVPHDDLQKVGDFLCKMTPTEERIVIPVGEALFVCNNRPPVTP